MKVILSKKGFDGTYGGFASPILEGGSMISLPIPALYREDHRIHYTDIRYGDDAKILDLLEKMDRSKVKVTKGKESEWKNARESPAHLDPDLRQESYPRRPDWRGLFGINGSSQTHIENETEGKGLEAGDLFLFFGWFEKYAYEGSKKLVNAENRKDYPTGRSVIFGYLQIDTILPLFKMRKDDARIEKWMDYHPHIGENRKIVGDSDNFPNNTLYVARKTFEKTEKPGFGLFRYDAESAEHITLTKKGCTRTQWGLSQVFTTPEPVKISRNPNGWKTWKEKGYFQSTKGYGQEFVIEERPEIKKWAKSLIDRFADI